MVTLGEILSECIDFERLLLEGKDPVEILHHKFGGIVPEHIIDMVIEADPTKKKSYSQWALSRYKEEPNTLKTSVADGKLKELFDYVQAHKEIQLPHLPSLSDALDKHVPSKDLIFSPHEDERADDYDMVFDDDEWRICVPNTYEAACLLGMNTKWCTANAYGNGEDYYERYATRGKLFVNFDKREPQTLQKVKFPYTRYQFHFESNSLMDAEDDSLTRDELDELLPESVVEWYNENGYTFEESYEERLEDYEQWRNEASYQIYDNLYLMPEWDDDMVIDDAARDTFYVYDWDNDTRDPISFVFQIYCPIQEISNLVEVIQVGDVILVRNKENDAMCAIMKNYDSYSHRDYDLTLVSHIAQGEGCYAFISGDSDSDKYLNVAFEDGRLLESNCKNGDVYINNDLAYESDYQYEICVEIAHKHGIQLIAFDENEEPIEVIRADYPAEGEHYTVDENGIIHGKYRSYRFVVDDETDEDGKFQVVRKLFDDIVEIEFEEDKSHNIYSITQQRVIGERNCKSIAVWPNGAYRCVNDTGMVYVMNANGKVISQTFKDVTMLSTKLEPLIGLIDGKSNGRCIVIDPQKGELITLKDIKSPLGKNKNFIYATQILDAEPYTCVYDWSTKKVVNLGAMIGHISSDKNYLDLEGSLILLIDKNSQYTIYDIDNGQVILSGVNKIGILEPYFSHHTYIYTFSFTEGGENIFNAIERKLLLPHNCENVMKMRNGDTSQMLACGIKDNGKIIYFDTLSNTSLATVNDVNNIECISIIPPYLHFKLRDDDGKVLNTYLQYNWENNQYCIGYKPITDYDENIQAQVKPYIDALGITTASSIKESFYRFFHKIKR